MRTTRKTDFRSRDIDKNNFSGIDISQGLDLEPPSLFPYFLLVAATKIACVLNGPIASTETIYLPEAL